MEMKKLMEVIAVESGLLNELLQVLKRETAEMTDVDVAAMNLSNLAKDELIARINSHASLFQKALNRVAAVEGIASPVTLGTLVDHLVKRGNSDLLTHHQQMCATVEEIRQIAVLNRDIAERFAASVTSSLTLITRLINQSNVYGASGSYQQRPASAVMINREA